VITLIEALNFRSLKYISQPLGPFHVLVGPNASGKTTFLDVVAFLGRLVSDGLDAAISERTQNFQDLVWGRDGSRFELAIEARIPEERRNLLENKKYNTVRYEVRLEFDLKANKIAILPEVVFLKTVPQNQSLLPTRFINSHGIPESILTSLPKDFHIIIDRGIGSLRTHFKSEIGNNWLTNLNIPATKSALANLPEDETQFPVAIWLRRLLIEGVQSIVFESQKMSKASPPGQGRGFNPDGSNLPWVISDLERRTPNQFQNWIAHLQTALPDFENIRVVEREDDRHRYLMVRYRNGLEIPSWMVSDGTLRLLALTLLAYLPENESIYLIEEPENGIHPRAIETVFQSLSSVYDSQVLLATHSPVILGIAELDKVLCFSKTQEGATAILPGDQHPALQNWHGEVNLGTLFAAGVLG
jgi:predicted ATPase